MALLPNCFSSSPWPKDALRKSFTRLWEFFCFSHGQEYHKRCFFRPWRVLDRVESAEANGCTMSWAVPLEGTRENPDDLQGGLAMGNSYIRHGIRQAAAWRCHGSPLEGHVSVANHQVQLGRENFLFVRKKWERTHHKHITQKYTLLLRKFGKRIRFPVQENTVKLNFLKKLQCLSSDIYQTCIL